MRRLCRLRPDDDVLDVGSGAGRTAIALTDFLDARARYEGFDVHPESVEWCQRNISESWPNFGFERVDLYSAAYNPGGEVRARDHRFGYEEGSFDVVLLQSVFTHLVPDDAANYVRECARVLRPGGRMLASYFLIDEESRALIERGESNERFGRDLGGYRVTDEQRPEAVVGVATEEALARYRHAGLEIVDPIHPGSWRGRRYTPTYQDLVVARR